MTVFIPFPFPFPFSLFPLPFVLSLDEVSLPCSHGVTPRLDHADSDRIAVMVAGTIVTTIPRASANADNVMAAALGH